MGDRLPAKSHDPIKRDFARPSKVIVVPYLKLEIVRLLHTSSKGVEPVKKSTSSSVIEVWDIPGSNIGSLCNSLEMAGAQPQLCIPKDSTYSSKLIILPGMSSPNAMRESLPSDLLERLGSSDPDGPLFLAICMGLHILFESTDERNGPESVGIAYFNGHVQSLSTLKPQSAQERSLRVPHVGSRALTAPDDGAHSTNAIAIPEGANFYFSHSYGIAYSGQSFVKQTFDYGGRLYSAYVHQGRVHGVQFHPEMSGPSGINFLRQLISLANA